MTNPRELYEAVASYMQRKVAAVVVPISLMFTYSGLKAAVVRVEPPTEIHPPEPDNPLHRILQENDRFHGLRDMDRQLDNTPQK